MIEPIRKFIGAAFLGLAAVVTAPLASAAIVTGSWDPALPDPPFVNLGWTTTINLKVSDACSEGAQSLPVIFNLFGRSFGCASSPFTSTSPFSILSAEVGIYDLSSNLIVDVLRFSPASFTPFLLNLESGGAITYLLSLTDSNAVQGNIDRTQAFNFKLDLPGAAPAIKYRGVGDVGSFITAPEVPLETLFAINPDSQQANILNRTRLEVGQAVFTAQVAEPGSLALAVLALGAAGGVARRRQRQQR